MRRQILDRLTRIAARMRRNQVVTPERGQVVKVNLGSGLSVAAGWINIDSSLNALASRLPAPLVRLTYRFSNAQRWYSADEYEAIVKNHVFIHHDLTYSIPLPDGSVDYIYSAHFIEHIYRDEAERLFRDAHRVLKAGGTMRINVPSFAEVVSVYQSGDVEEAIDSIFFRGARDEAGWYSRHRYMYDLELLTRLLQEAGFTKIIGCQRGIGSVPDIELFEGRRSSRGLYVEATTGGRMF